MTSDRPLGTFSDEIDRVLLHVDRRMEELGRHVNGRLDEIGQDVKEIKVEARATNGRVTRLEIWQARLEGMTAATGMNWRVLAGVITTVVAISALAVSIAVAAMR